MIEFEYVEKNEYRPVKQLLEDTVIRKIQNHMKKNHMMSFHPQLVGSGEKHIVTRIKGGNAGYDFDYNFVIKPPDTGKEYKADVVRKYFIEAINDAIKGTAYSNPSDRTTAITIKVVDRKNSKIVHSCDFAIVYYDNDRTENGYYVLKHNKSVNTYSFEFRNSSKNLKQIIDYIKSYYNDGWNVIKEEYLKLKNNNKDENKTSSILFLEAVHNVDNWILQEEEQEEYYDDED